jgi:hypothetical protein
MDTKDLVSGEVYFMITFPDPEMQKPIIITYQYVRQAAVNEKNLEEGFIFKYLPAFRYEMDDGEMFPDDKKLIILPFEEIESLVDLSGLILELNKVRESR